MSQFITRQNYHTAVALSVFCPSELPVSTETTEQVPWIDCLLRIMAATPANISSGMQSFCS